ncbi:MAG: mechanosensitive ion channel family protein [Candidatus Absconditabacteria bacterium]
MQETTAQTLAPSINTEPQNQLFGGLNANTLGIHVVKVFIAIFVMIILVALSRSFSSFIKAKIIKNTVIENDEYAQKLGSLVGDIVFYVFCVFAVLIGFEIIGFDVGFIIGGLSFGIGFAFKDILSNLISGVFLMTTKEFKLGDIVELIYDPINGLSYFGRIEEITIRYTVIRTLDLRRVVIPNLSMVTNPIKTFNSEEVIRLETSMSVPFDCDVDNYTKVIKSAIISIDFVREHDGTRILVNGFSDKGIDLRILFYVDPNCGFARPRIIGEVNKKIYDAMKENKLDISYPHTTITVDKNDKNLLGTILFAKKN